MRVLLVEDDALLGKALRTGLEQLGYAADWVTDGVAAEAAARAVAYDAVVLDLGLPRRDGLDVLRNLRRGGHAEPVLIITARDEIEQRVTGLDAGADDFLTKPVDLQELGARLRAATRRAAGRAGPLIRIGAVAIDPASRSVSRDGVPVALTGREMALLLCLAGSTGRVHSRAQLEESLYSWESSVESNAIEVHVHNLRRKLGRELIQTVHGQGYRIAVAPVPASSAGRATDA
jgi:two-component system, OmpR family, response regulator QseB